MVLRSGELCAWASSTGPEPIHAGACNHCSRSGPSGMEAALSGRAGGQGPTDQEQEATAGPGDCGSGTSRARDVSVGTSQSWRIGPGTKKIRTREPLHLQSPMMGHAKLDISIFTKAVPFLSTSFLEQLVVDYF